MSGSSALAARRFAQIESAQRTLAQFGSGYQAVLVLAAVVLAAFAVLPQARRWRGVVLAGAAMVLAVGELALVWFHWRIYAVAVVVDPATSQVTGRPGTRWWRT